MEDWRYLADVAALAFLVVSLVEIVKIHVIRGGWLRRKNRKGFDRSVKAIIAPLMGAAGVKRFLVLVAENGGGRPRKGRPLYVTVTHEQFLPPFRSVKEEYYRLLVDEPYHDLINDLISDNSMTYLVKDMPFGFLRDIYEAEGVALSQLFYLHETPSFVAYCSVATDVDGIGVMSAPAAQLQIKLAINKLSHEFQNEYKTS